VGWQVRECLIWNKSSLVIGRQDYQWKHEPCLYGWKDGASHLWASDRKQTTVLDFDKPLASKLHPTMKPVALFAYQIGNNTHEGDAVLDLFGGSGTTLIACEQLGRRAFTSELDPKYCDVIVKRYINLKGSEDGVFVLREGTKIPYSEIKKDN
jgi:site-specific DNA-methyltransferase (adenine-specific)